ncbi:hypothetical protein LC040_14165 [Bacillus tianshenii]|nr:hypothetical protein LC040_14165 [Bacillus tianshenii]
MHYETYMLKGSLENEKTATQLKYSLNAWAEEGFTLHTIIPQVVEGTTQGHLLIFVKSK